MSPGWSGAPAIRRRCPGVCSSPRCICGRKKSVEHRRFRRRLPAARTRSRPSWPRRSRCINPRVQRVKRRPSTSRCGTSPGGRRARRCARRSSRAAPGSGWRAGARGAGCRSSRAPPSSPASARRRRTRARPPAATRSWRPPSSSENSGSSSRLGRLALAVIRGLDAAEELRADDAAALPDARQLGDVEVPVAHARGDAQQVHALA